jgi:hypothetical protein
VRLEPIVGGGLESQVMAESQASQVMKGLMRAKIGNQMEFQTYLGYRIN